MTASVVVVGAGSGTRLGGPERKAWVDVGGRPLWWHSCRIFRGLPGVAECVLVLHPGDLARTEESAVRDLLAAAGIAKVAVGGQLRQESVLAGVRVTDPSVRDVLVHDAARPLVRPDRVVALMDVLGGSAAGLLAAPVTSTVKVVSPDGAVAETLDRSRLRLASTPQGGRRALLLDLLERAAAAGFEATDEAGLFEWGGIAPRIVDDSTGNLKITGPEDLDMVRAALAPPWPRVGHGYDIHRLVPGRPLVLGGVTIPSELGLLGHSDGDCVLHAVIEALLGAAGLPDIGEHFPDRDPRYAGAPSSRLLAEVLAELNGLGHQPRQIDCSILAERPRLGPWKAAIRENLARQLGLPADRVAVKARTGEGLDAIGRGEAIAVHCVAVVA